MIHLLHDIEEDSDISDQSESSQSSDEIPKDSDRFGTDRLSEEILNKYQKAGDRAAAVVISKKYFLKSAEPDAPHRHHESSPHPHTQHHHHRDDGFNSAVKTIIGVCAEEVMGTRSDRVRQSQTTSVGRPKLDTGKTKLTAEEMIRRTEKLTKHIKISGQPAANVHDGPVPEVALTLEEQFSVLKERHWRAELLARQQRKKEGLGQIPTRSPVKKFSASGGLRASLTSDSFANRFISEESHGQMATEAAPGSPVAAGTGFRALRTAKLIQRERRSLQNELDEVADDDSQSHSEGGGGAVARQTGAPSSVEETSRGRFLAAKAAAATTANLIPLATLHTAEKAHLETAAGVGTTTATGSVKSRELFSAARFDPPTLPVRIELSALLPDRPDCQTSHKSSPVSYSSSPIKGSTQQTLDPADTQHAIVEANMPQRALITPAIPVLTAAPKGYGSLTIISSTASSPQLPKDSYALSNESSAATLSSAPSPSRRHTVHISDSSSAQGANQGVSQGVSQEVSQGFRHNPFATNRDEDGEDRDQPSPLSPSKSHMNNRHPLHAQFLNRPASEAGESEFPRFRARMSSQHTISESSAALNSNSKTASLGPPQQPTPTLQVVYQHPASLPQAASPSPRPQFTPPLFSRQSSNTSFVPKPSDMLKTMLAEEQFKLKQKEDQAAWALAEYAGILVGQYSEQRKKRATKLMESKLREEYLSEDSAFSGEDEVLSEDDLSDVALDRQDFIEARAQDRTIRSIQPIYTRRRIRYGQENSPQPINSGRGSKRGLQSKGLAPSSSLNRLPSTIQHFSATPYQNTFGVTASPARNMSPPGFNLSLSPGTQSMLALSTAPSHVDGDQRHQQISEDEADRIRAKHLFVASSHRTALFANRFGEVDMTQLMEKLISESLSSKDTRRTLAEEITLIFSGFRKLETNGDGFLSSDDMLSFLGKFHSQTVSKETVEHCLWTLDDSMRDCLTFVDVMKYYLRVRWELAGCWIDLNLIKQKKQMGGHHHSSTAAAATAASDVVASRLREHPTKASGLESFQARLNEKTERMKSLDSVRRRPLSAPTGGRNLSSSFNEKQALLDSKDPPSSPPKVNEAVPASASLKSKTATQEKRETKAVDNDSAAPSSMASLYIIAPHVQDALESMDLSEPLMMYRILLFTALQDSLGFVHLLSAYEHLIGLFGTQGGELKFQQLFLRTTEFLTDEDVIHLADFVNATKAWDCVNKKILSSMQKGINYSKLSKLMKRK